MKHTSKASSKLSKQPRASNLQDRSSTEYVDEPLRSRPLHQLNLDDFKINPNANHGLDFAFSEVVRGRDARRCLPGCTKPECCGRAFRAMVEAGATPNLPRNARVKLLADQVGRHRQAYQRRSTPPGFWRADFPSTQEERRDREEAERREREKVEKRWLEAMREGGRWLFRDE
ncbi:DNA repair protein Sae2 [Patellaria atrata CBS 101060]|uniref:DNA repair protein Sae2 n=1 Tax=Patellaria atrata CBS 101060 TaxID=1346257 RepID=A0A9P4S7Y8_9PEZI|nr:DNA repair protein Sae2 [Patellaria atrata CBS 101060]